MPPPRNRFKNPPAAPVAGQVGNEPMIAQINVLGTIRNGPNCVSMDSSGLTVSVHPVLPEMNYAPGELFFECTLFLYSVLALFLQYLNLYKTLWWLPKSYWHYSLKFHQINPYFLSCVGLLLGLRVTKCFWKTITEVVNKWSSSQSQFVQSTLTVIEYAFIKTPMMTMVVTSFMFSFTKVCHDFPLNSILYFFYPLFLYWIIFRAELAVKWHRVRESVNLWWNNKVEISEIFDRFAEPPPYSLDHETIAHMCSTQPAQIREEVSILLEDLYFRLRRCVFAGVSTAFLSICLPCVFVPYKTNLGLPQTMLIDYTWETELFVVVALTSFSLYITYLFPLNYLDLLHRAAVHMGSWDRIDEANTQSKGVSLTPLWTPGDALHPEGSIVSIPDGRRYRAVGNPMIGTVAAEPGNPEHFRFYRLCSRPSTLINLLCICEGILIIAQFWMLVLTTDWQHIVTLVLLMFANYLLLAKLFKDKVILGRIYEPSPEDKALMEQLQSEANMAHGDSK